MKDMLRELRMMEPATHVALLFAILFGLLLLITVAGVLYRAKNPISSLQVDPRSGRVLYRRLERGRALPEVVLAEGDKKTTILTGKALVAGFLGTDLVGATTVNGASMQVFVGPRGKTLSRVITLNQPYSVVFLRDAPAFVLQSPTELRLYRVER